jgi:hypothetical protein
MFSYDYVLYLPGTVDLPCVLGLRAISMLSPEKRMDPAGILLRIADGLLGNPVFSLR